MAFMALGLLSPQAMSHGAPQVKVIATGARKHAYIVGAQGDFLKIDTSSMMLEARWNLRWVQGGQQLLQDGSAPDVFQTRSNDRDLYATIALNGRDNPTASWRLVRFSLPSFAVAATAELSGATSLPIILSASQTSVMVGWSDTAKMTTTLLILDPATLNVTAKKMVPTIIASNQAFMRDDPSKIIDWFRQIDVATGKDEIFPVYFALPPAQRAVLDKDFSTPDPATQKPYTAFGVSDSANGTILLLAADAPSGGKTAFWTFDLESRKTSQLFVTTSASARITPSGSLIVLQHTTGGMDSETTGSIEMIDTKTGDSHKAHFSQLEGPLGSNHLICVADDSAIFASEDGIYILPLPSAASLTRINTTFVSDQYQTCTLTRQ